LNSLIYVLIVTMQLGDMVGGHIGTISHIEAITLPGHLSATDCALGSGYAAGIVASNPLVREMKSKGWQLERWDCQRDVYAGLRP
jgi:hypothetical protein